jgi:translocation and assembly module TamB
MRRAITILLVFVAVLLLLVDAAVVVFTHSSLGRDRARSIVLGLLRDKVKGEVRIGRIEGNLADRFSLVNVSISDQPGQPFFTADRIDARMAIRSLVSKRIVFTDLALIRPVVRLVKDTSGTWNWRRIFPVGRQPMVDTTLGFGSWVTLENVRVSGGTLIVRQPWEPDPALKGAARDSAVAVALNPKSRTRVEPVAGGYVKTIDFRSIDGHVPAVVLAHPDSSAISFRVDTLSTIAGLFRPPEIDVRNLTTDVRISHDTLTARRLVLSLPSSHITGTVTYLVTANDVLLALTGDHVAFADLRALYTPLPDSGGGSLALEAAVRDSSPSDYTVRNARLRVADTRIDGGLGVVIGAHIIRFHDTDVRLTQFPTALVERLAPRATIPTSGSFSGRAQVVGPLEGMRVDVEGTFDPDRHAPFHVLARGGVGVEPALRAAQLHLLVDGMPADFLHEFDPSLPVGGTITADATVSGSVAATLTGSFSVTHRENGSLSRIAGTGTVAPRGTQQMNVVARLTPLSMQLAQDFAPNAPVRGEITGMARVSGTPRDLEAHAALVLPAGTLDADGNLKRGKGTPVYNASIRVRDVDVHALVPGFPTTTLNGTATFAGSGTNLATINARAAADLRDFVFDSTRFLQALVHASARDGLLTVDTVSARTAFATAVGRGTFGLVAGRAGRLDYHVDVRSLSGLERWIATTDTGTVPPRPGVRQRMARMAARIDSMHQVQRADTANIATLAAQADPWLRRRRPPPLPNLPPLPRDSIAGAVSVTGQVSGSLQRFTAGGTARTSGVIWGGSEIGRGQATFTYADGHTPNATLTAELGVDSVRAMGFAFDSTHVRGRYHNREGDVALQIFPGDTAEYRMSADYVLRQGGGEVRLRDIQLRMDSTTWVSPHESAIQWRGHAVAVDSFELRARTGGGHLFINGELPDGDPGALAVDIDSLSVAPWLTLLQSDAPVGGRLTFKGNIEGTRDTPRLSGQLALLRASYKGTPFPDLRATFRYDQRQLVVNGDLRRGTGNAPPLAQIRGSLPVDLSLGDSVRARLTNAPITLDVVGDSIPLGPLQQFDSTFSVIDGRARGAFGLRGTLTAPRIVGEMTVDLRRLGIAATGVTFTGTTAHLRMVGDTLVIDSLFARSGGTIRGGGTVALRSLTRPVLTLRVQANGARVLNNANGELFADSRLTIVGPIDTLVVSGRATITRGVVYVPDPERMNLINTGDPVVLYVVDSATIRALGVGPPSPLLRNMDIDVDLTVNRGTWARARDANIEMYGDIHIHRDPDAEGLALTGALYTDQGDYTLYGHRFLVTRGSVRFVGDPEINPTLQILATYQVRQAGRAPFDIHVEVGGTVRRPNVALSSDAQPTLSQSDLLSFLAFGQSSTSLLQFQGSGLQGGGQSGSSLAGNVSALATRQLASIAVGAMVDQAKADLARATRADVVYITPADLPADMSLGGFGNVLRGTEVELGKYVDQRTFVVGKIRPTLAVPGASLERRYGDRFKVRLSAETRYQPPRPSLTASLRPASSQVFGGLLTWSVHW